MNFQSWLKEAKCKKERDSARELKERERERERENNKSGLKFSLRRKIHHHFSLGLITPCKEHTSCSMLGHISILNK
jgi:hypothetical protein